MTWPTVALGEVSQPRQWPILPRAEMSQAGYPVFGANGLIGFSGKVTHDRPTVVIGCRGTCGAVHLTEGPTYVNGNAMAIDLLDEGVVDPRFLAHYLRWRGLSDVTTGSSQPQITRQNLVRIRIPAPPLPEQRRIASILDQADSICSRFRRASDLWAALGRSYYSKILTSDGDRGFTWPRVPIGDLGQVVTGQTPPGGETTVESDDVPFITPGDLGDTDAAPKRYLSAANVARSRIVKPGSLLVCCIGTIGKSRTFERPVAFNQQINAIEWGPNVLPDFGEFAVASITAEMQARASSTTLPILRKSTFEQFVIPVPPLAVQQELSEVVSKTRAIRGLTAEAGKTAAALQRSLADGFFRGSVS